MATVTLGQVMKEVNEKIAAALKNSKETDNEIIDKIVTEMTKKLRPMDMSNLKLPQYFTPKESATGSTGRSYKSIFGKTHLGNSGFSSLGEFASGIALDRIDSRYDKGMSEGDPSAGGFAVPEEFRQILMQVLLETSYIMRGATIFPMRSNTLRIPCESNSTLSSGLYGGNYGTWINEKGTISETSPELTEMTLTAHKLATFCTCTSELLADGPNFENWITQVLQNNLSTCADQAFLTGSGAGRPMGILNSPALITVDAETGQTADTVVWENICKMAAAFYQPSFSNATWICHQSLIPQLLSMSLSIGTSGSHIAVMNSESGVYKLLTRPVVFTSKLPKLGDLGDIMLVDFSQYGIGLRETMRLERSSAINWSTDQISFRAIVRMDGQTLWRSTLTLEDGSTQVSPFVTLAARA